MGYKNSSGKCGYVYILTNKSKSVLYIGVSSTLDKRIIEHKYGQGSKFTIKYNCTILLYYEKYPNINEAIAREKQLKNWHRSWKLNLIKSKNPTLNNLWKNLS
ncbi:GIY-YIG nuclease family protein [Fodinibius halophilus]|uniref:GIY-YIG nuclease family protein n=1 Tax=Fodinibius halophilus TaxID=1736908 RepID=A0A6M1TC51_9BACT|nr:GIY-YIG nuclease family protein [Fodinibius halophilus]NGP87812.1 GIY-YIG nuclease family protein [Fodinibius halophilus]